MARAATGLLLLLLPLVPLLLAAASPATDGVTDESVTSYSDVMDVVAELEARPGAWSLVPSRAGAPSLGWGRPRRSPAQQDPPPKKRRRKGRRRGRKRGRGRGRKRTTTTAAPTEAPTTTAAPTTTTPRPTTTARPEKVAPRRGGAQRRPGGRRRRPDAPTPPPAPVAPPVPDYNIAPAGTVNGRPVIGVLSQTLPAALNALVPDVDFTSYIAASYVKLLEAAGARVVPVLVDQSDHYYREMYRYLNGLLLPSGEASVRDTPYVRAVRSVWAVAGKHPKDHFPVLGISRGMEMIAKVEQDRIRFADCDAINMAGQLHIETDGERSSLLRDVDAPLRRALASGSLTYSSHGRCLTPERLEAGGLAEDFRAVATGRDRAGRKFVSVMEHKRLPIFGVQFSPQMSPFEWARSAEVDAVPRAPDAIRLSQLIANAFVDEARKSRHRFPSPELEEDYLIYNYEPEFTGVVGSTYTSCYFFS